MKLLLDQGLPRSAADLLTQAGVDCIHVSSIGLSAADDALIIQKALELDRVVVTLDADFHTLLALSGATAPAVIRIRIEGLKAPSVRDLVLSVIQQCGDDLKSAVVTVTENRIRLRKLPLL